MFVIALGGMSKPFSTSKTYIKVSENKLFRSHMKKNLQQDSSQNINLLFQKPLKKSNSRNQEFIKRKNGVEIKPKELK